MEPRNKEFRLQLYARAAAPCRDYYGLTINQETVVLNIWKISHGPHVYPKMTRNYLCDYPHDKQLQNEIDRLFGSFVNEYIIELAKDKIMLQCLPTRAFLCILRFLAKKDIIHLSQTSKIFFQLCQTDNVWKLIFEKILKRKPNYYEEQNAIDCGWKEVLNGKLFRLRNISTITSNTKIGEIHSKIKYNSLRLDTDGEKQVFGKAGGDGLKPVTKVATVQVKTAAKSSRKSVERIVSKPAVKTSDASLPKVAEEQYTSTLARRVLKSTPKVKITKSANK